jgi:ABC-type dipeptide/oligopeptide/nickel transport system ATPase component
MTINFYEAKGMAKHLSKTVNPHFKSHGIKVPFRMLIVGSSGSGKTNTLLNLIYRMPDTFQKIIVITADKNEPLYNYLSEKSGGEKAGVTIQNFDEKGLPDLSEFSRDSNTLLVLDDLVNRSPKEQAPISEFYLRARKKGVSLVYISQSFYATPKMIRNNLSHILLKQVSSSRNLALISKECSIGIKKKVLTDMYEDAVKDMGFLLFDLDNNQRPFRKGLDEYYELDEADKD